jgi:hypothetical protein
LAFFAILGRLTDLWSVSFPDKPKDALLSMSVIIPAGVYYLTPFRSWANRKYFDRVSENLRANMVRISGLGDEPYLYTWRALRGVFFHLVDNDKSLSMKASLAYFNGYIWTTCADLRVIAFTYVMITAVFAWIGIEGWDLALVLFAIIAGVSYLGSTIVTKRHRLIGNEQLEILELYYRNELRTALEEIRDRRRGTGN